MFKKSLIAMFIMACSCTYAGKKNPLEQNMAQFKNNIEIINERIEKAKKTKSFFESDFVNTCV